jgi:integrase
MGASTALIAKIQKAWTRETFRKYRRTLTRLDEWLEETGTEERTLLEATTANVQMANFIVSLEGKMAPTVIRAMLGHTRRILRLLNPDPGQGVLATIAKAMGKETPATSRRYDTIWEIDRLFEWIRTHWEDNASLPLEELQTKTMMLIMIYSACRLAELGRMERPAGYRAADATMTFTTTLKQRQDMRQQVTIRRISRRELCAVEAAECWLARAPPTADTRLFHQLQCKGTGEAGKEAGQPLTTAQIAPKLLKAMRAAGIPP